MKIALFGATGAVSGYFLNKGLSAGHEVIALARSPEKLGSQPNLFELQYATEYILTVTGKN